MLPLLVFLLFWRERSRIELKKQQHFGHQYDDQTIFGRDELRLVDGDIKPSHCQESEDLYFEV